LNDKAKPRAIVGRKATGPTGIAGLPKSGQRNRITVASYKMVIRFLFYGVFLMSDDQQLYAEGRLKQDVKLVIKKGR
jgi:hypothetical protein